MSELGSIQKVDAFLREKDDSSEICRALYEALYAVSLLLARLDEVGTVLMNKLSGKPDYVRVRVVYDCMLELPLGTSTMHGCTYEALYRGMFVYRSMQSYKCKLEPADSLPEGLMDVLRFKPGDRERGQDVMLHDWKGLPGKNGFLISLDTWSKHERGLGTDVPPLISSLSVLKCVNLFAFRILKQCAPSLKSIGRKL